VVERWLRQLVVRHALLTLAFWVAVIWVVVGLLRYRTGPTPPAGARPARPEEILAQRYARGEIDDDEYHRPLDTLRGAPCPGDRP
jgi:putative membrane protein